MVNNQNKYIRKQGNRQAVKGKDSISFSWSKLDNTQGQTIKDWEDSGLLSDLCIRLQQIGQYHSSEALAKQLIKQYTKHKYKLPDNSKFNEPKHIECPEVWSVIHITPTSKEVVAGYIEDDVFYIVFLDKDHLFWPTDIQSRGKNKK
jgi:hypothetical protein